jgi:hypothetical protein
MNREIRNRIVRPATSEEKQRHEAIRGQVSAELAELNEHARQVVAQHHDRIAVGTVFSGDETAIVTAIDDYAAAHALESRSDVVREALSRLLDIPIVR